MNCRWMNEWSSLPSTKFDFYEPGSTSMVCDITNSLDPGALFSMNKSWCGLLPCTNTEDWPEVGGILCSNVILSCFFVHLCKCRSERKCVCTPRRARGGGGGDCFRSVKLILSSLSVSAWLRTQQDMFASSSSRQKKTTRAGTPSQPKTRPASRPAPAGLTSMVNMLFSCAHIGSYQLDTCSADSFYLFFSSRHLFFFIISIMTTIYLNQEVVTLAVCCTFSAVASERPRAYEEGSARRQPLRSSDRPGPWHQVRFPHVGHQPHPFLQLASRSRAGERGAVTQEVPLWDVLPSTRTKHILVCECAWEAFFFFFFFEVGRWVWHVRSASACRVWQPGFFFATVPVRSPARTEKKRRISKVLAREPHVHSELLTARSRCSRAVGEFFVPGGACFSCKSCARHPRSLFSCKSFELDVASFFHSVTHKEFDVFPKKNEQNKKKPHGILNAALERCFRVVATLLLVPRLFWHRVLSCSCMPTADGVSCC